VGRPSQQTVIGQAAVKNVDSRQWQITAGAHVIKSSSRVVGGALNPLYQTVTRQKIVELDCVRVVDSFETYIDVTDKRQRLDVRRQTIKKISEFAEEAGGYSGRARAINDSYEKPHRVAGNASSDELERSRLNADVNFFHFCRLIQFHLVGLWRLPSSACLVLQISCIAGSNSCIGPNHA